MFADADVVHGTLASPMARAVRNREIAAAQQRARSGRSFLPISHCDRCRFVFSLRSFIWTWEPVSGPLNVIQPSMEPGDWRVECYGQALLKWSPVKWQFLHSAPHASGVFVVRSLPRCRARPLSLLPPSMAELCKRAFVTPPSKERPQTHILHL